MLKPEQLKAHRFISVTRDTYEAGSVDSFFAEVSASYEQMFRENGELVKKISLLAERVSQYKNDEDNIRRALLTAERMSDKIQREAQQFAQEKLDTAERKAGEILSAAQSRAEGLETAASINATRVTEESQKAADERMATAERTATERLETAEKTATERLTSAENTANERLASAERAATALITDAEKTAAEIIEKSKGQAQLELDRILADIEANSSALAILSDEVTRFKSALLGVYREHIELISSLPKTVKDIKEPVVEKPVEVAVSAPVEEIAAEEPAFEEIAVEEVSDEFTAEPAVEEVTVEDVSPISADELVENEAVVQTSLFNEEVSDEIDLPTEVPVAEVVSEEVTEAVEETPVYDPMDAVAASEFNVADEPAEKEDEVDSVILEEEKENYLKGFVIDLSEIESTIEVEQAPTENTESGSSTIFLDKEKEEESTNHSRFRGFFKK